MVVLIVIEEQAPMTDEDWERFRRRLLVKAEADRVMDECLDAILENRTDE